MNVAGYIAVTEGSGIDLMCDTLLSPTIEAAEARMFDDVADMVDESASWVRAHATCTWSHDHDSVARIYRIEVWNPDFAAQYLYVHILRVVTQ